MEKRLDRTDKKVGKTAQEPRKPSFLEMQCKRQEKTSERQYTGNMSEAAQVRTSSLRDRHSKPDASAYRDRQLELKQQIWEAKQSGSRVPLEPSDGSRFGLQSQDNKVKSRPDEKKSNTSELGQKKGSWGDETDGGSLDQLAAVLDFDRFNRFYGKKLNGEETTDLVLNKGTK